jgi:two-component system, OmpR family, sensor histidine kinase KdpD
METQNSDKLEDIGSINDSNNFNQRRAYKLKNLRYTITAIWKSSLMKYVQSAFIISIAGIVLYYLHVHIGYQSVSLIFLFIVTLLPLLNFKPGPIFLAAVMSACIWNYYFIPPSFTFRIGKMEDALMFCLYFVIASVSGFLISRIRMQRLLIDQKEKKTAALYDLARGLSSAKSLDDVTEYSVRQLKETFRTEVVFIYSVTDKTLNKKPHPSSTFNIDEGEWNIAQLVFLSSVKVGRFTNAVPSISQVTHLPLFTKDRKLGVVGLVFPENSSLNKEMESLLDTFISQISIAVEREYLKELAKENLVIAESEKLYKTLFDSISHELKTPITAILGAVSSLRDEKIIKNQSIFLRLIEETNIAAQRLKRLVENLLDITRLESGILKLKREWHSISDLINSALNKLQLENTNHNITCNIEEDIGLLNFDFPLLEQSLINIFHNSMEYTPSDSRIEITAKRKEGNITFTVSDNGRGFPEEEIKNLFRKFYRIPGTKSGGTGLGLSIAKGFIEAHGGTITAKNRISGGAEFIILLPTK